jgi:hypothetical protein
MMVVENRVAGFRKGAVPQGLPCIAAYIFGSHTPAKKTAMAAPLFRHTAPEPVQP